MKFALVLLSLVSLSTIKAAPIDSRFGLRRGPGSGAEPFQPCNPDYNRDACIRPDYECLKAGGGYMCFPREGFKESVSSIRAAPSESHVDLREEPGPDAGPFQPCNPDLDERSCFSPDYKCTEKDGYICFPRDFKSDLSYTRATYTDDSRFGLRKSSGRRAGALEPCDRTYGSDACSNLSFECVEEDEGYNICLPGKTGHDLSRSNVAFTDDSRFDILRKGESPNARPYEPCDPDFGLEACFSDRFECVNFEGNTVCIPRRNKL